MKEIQVLDKGYIKLLNVMGTDESITSNARITTGSQNEDVKKLMNFLFKNKHLSPFEMAEVQFEVKAPIFVVRQWFRHRTANILEKSGRYSILEPEFYIPEVDYIIRSKIMDTCEHARYVYEKLINNGTKAELARIVLPLNTYTEFIWKIDLRNLFHFLDMRNTRHAQFEIRKYAEAILSILNEEFPVATTAYLNNKEIKK